MRKIRKNVFETNSSSLHSICVAENRMHTQYDPEEVFDDDLYVSKNGDVNIDSEDCYFGRYPFRILFSMYDKLKYMIAEFQDNEELVKKLEDIFIRECNKAVDTLSDEGKATRYIRKIKKITYVGGYGSIDRQSCGMLSCYLAYSHIEPEAFLLDPSYVIIIDGDEYNTFGKYQNAGFLKELKIVG